MCGLGKECPRLPARHWRAGAPLPQSRSSSKLLPGSQRRESQGHRAARALLELPQASHCRTPRLCGRASCPALPSGPQAGARQERERKRRRTKQGKGGREGQETRRSSKEEGGRWPGPRGRFSTAPADSARRGPGGGIAGEERASGASARPARAGEGASVSRRGPVTFLGRGRGAGGQRQSALGPAGSMWRPGNCGDS